MARNCRGEPLIRPFTSRCARAQVKSIRCVSLARSATASFRLILFLSILPSGIIHFQAGL